MENTKYNEEFNLRIRKSIEGLTEEPPKGDIKTLQRYTGGQLRVGKYRMYTDISANLL